MHKRGLIRYTPVVLSIGIIALGLLCPEHALANSPGGTGLPWETPIQRVVDSFLGPVAMGMILIGFVGGVWNFLVGGEINGFIRSMVVMVLSGSVLLGAKPFIQSVYGGGNMLGL